MSESSISITELISVENIIEDGVNKVKKTYLVKNPSKIQTDAFNERKKWKFGYGLESRDNNVASPDTVNPGVIQYQGVYNKSPKIAFSQQIVKPMDSTPFKASISEPDTELFFKGASMPLSDKKQDSDKTIKISNLSRSVDKQLIQDFMNDQFNRENVVRVNRTKMFAFVVFKSRQIAEYALQILREKPPCYDRMVWDFDLARTN